jgi:hypothetical protein
LSGAYILYVCTLGVRLESVDYPSLAA